MAGLIVSFIVYISKQQWLRDIGTIAIFASVILLTLIYSLGSYVGTFAADANQATIIQNVIDGFTSRLSTFLTWVLILGVIAWVAGLTWEKYNWPSKLVKRVKQVKK